jgi:mRNA deadenylase 3'-5' endonuclease subunit Ccr4
MRVDADLVAIEEIDHFNDFFEPALNKFGYVGVFVPKANSPSCSFGYFSDGVALFWRPNKFRPVLPSSSSLENDDDVSNTNNQSPEEAAAAVVAGEGSGGGYSPCYYGGAISLAQTPSPTVVASLQHIPSKKNMVVGVTHLKAKPGLVNEERRKSQIDAVLTTMNNVIKCFICSNGADLEIIIIVHSYSLI